MNLIPTDLLHTLPVADLARLDASTLFHLKNQIEARATQIKIQAAHIDAALEKRYGMRITALRQSANKEFGVIHLADGPVKITVDQRKLVNWDQSCLRVIARNITAHGQNVSDFMDTEYLIPEPRFTAWNSTLKEQFAPARTVKAGKANFKLALDDDKTAETLPQAPASD